MRSPILFALLFANTSALADCPSLARDLHTRWSARQPFDVPVLTHGEATCIQRQFEQLLEAEHGAPVGYKAGLTNPVVRQQFGADAPLRGTLFGRFLLEGGAEVSASFGARPVVEADLLVVVRSSELMKAKTRAEALAGLSAVVPFIELPDLVAADPKTLKATGIQAINVGARLGVRGRPVTEFTEASLGAMAVTLERDGAVVAEGRGSDLMGHPLDVVLWLVESLAADGRALKAGDILSLGTLGRPVPPVAGATFTARYSGLGDVSVRFAADTRP